MILRVGTWNVEYARGVEKNRPDATRPARGWEEFHRIVPRQGGEWASMRTRWPDATLVVAGDLNQDLGGRPVYGTHRGRALLGAELGRAGLTCLTTTDQFGPDVLEHPPIDHICAGPGRGGSITSDAHGWNKDPNGVRLSDHGGTLVSLTIEPGSRESPARKSSDNVSESLVDKGF